MSAVQDGRLDYSEAARVDALSIVESIGTERRSTRTAAFTSQKKDGSFTSDQVIQQSVWIEKLRVVDSLAFRKGTIIHCLSPIGRQLPCVLSPGTRYLLFAVRQSGNKLFVPNGLFRQGGIQLDSTSDTEVGGLAVLETKADKLDGSGDPATRLFESVLQCMNGVSDQTFRRTWNWLLVAGYPGGGIYSDIWGRDPFPISEQIASFADTSSPYRRAKLYQLLCEWHVSWSESKLIHALAEAGADPTAYTNDGDIWRGGELNFNKRYGTDPIYDKQFDYTPDQWLTWILQSKSPAIQIILLQDDEHTLSDAQNVRLASLLGSPNEKVQWAVTEHLSRNYHEPSRFPKLTKIGATSVWSEKAQLVSYWRARLGLVNP